MELQSIGGPFTTSSLYFTSPKFPFPALLSQGQALGQTPAFPINGKKLFPPKPFLHLKGRALKGMKATGKVGCPLQQTLPHLTHFLCATFQVCYPSSQTQKRGMIIQLCLRWAPVSQPHQSQHPNHGRKRADFYFISIPRASGGNPSRANPKAIPLSSHLFPPTGRNKSRKGQVAQGGKSLHHIGFSFPLLQTMPRICNLQSALPWHLPASGDAGTGRNPPANLPGSGTAMFFSPGLPAARAASSTIGQSPTTVHPPPSAAPPSAVSFP